MIIRVMLLIFGLGILSAFVLSWAIVDIAQLYDIPYLREFTAQNMLGLALLKSVIEGNLKMEMEKRKTEPSGDKITETKLVIDILMYFVSRIIMIVMSVGTAHIIYKIII